MVHIGIKKIKEKTFLNSSQNSSHLLLTLVKGNSQCASVTLVILMSSGVLSLPRLVISCFYVNSIYILNFLFLTFSSVLILHLNEIDTSHVFVPAYYFPQIFPYIDYLVDRFHGNYSTG